MAIMMAITVTVRSADSPPMIPMMKEASVRENSARKAPRFFM